jgi:hypothetical protein
MADMTQPQDLIDEASKLLTAFTEARLDQTEFTWRLEEGQRALRGDEPSNPMEKLLLAHSNYTAGRWERLGGKPLHPAGQYESELLQKFIAQATDLLASVDDLHEVNKRVLNACAALQGTWTKE